MRLWATCMPGGYKLGFKCRHVQAVAVTCAVGVYDLETRYPAAT